MPQIKFTRDTLEHEGEPHKTGDVLDCSEASAERWVLRDAAVPYTEPKAKAVQAPPEDKAIKQAPKDKAVKRGSSPNK